jgi:SAM-dependent methyltransferase
MSRLGEQILLTLNRWVPGSNRALTAAKLDPAEYVAFFGRRSDSSFGILGPLDLECKDILDLGCGLGSNLVFLCKQKASRITALDIDPATIKSARSILSKNDPQNAARVDFVPADAARLPFGTESYNAIVSLDTFEHIDDIRGALMECARVLRPGGRLYILFPPFLAPWGAHMVNWIHIPWIQLLFSEPTMLNAARRLEREGAATNNQLPPETHLDLGDGDRIPFVNHISLNDFESALDSVPALKTVRVRLFPPGWRSGGLIVRILQPLTRIRALRDIFTAKAVYVLEK